MKKTGIVCTMGPASASEAVLKAMIEAGMNVARINFAHGEMDQHLQTIETVRNVARGMNAEVAILLDIKGPEIRIGKLKEASVTLSEGQSFTLTTDVIDGDASRVTVSHKNLPAEVIPGTVILLDDGLIALRVVEASAADIICTVTNGGVLKPRKGVNIPGIRTSLPGVTERDKEHIRFGIKHNVDYIAMSFVRKAEDVLEVKAMLSEGGAERIQVVSKIENQEGLDNFGDILAASDGIMVARGDLGVEIPIEEVPFVQKQMIRECNAAGKPVITATHMLESMQSNPRPTRAEASDVANAVLDGTDYLMLSGESAVGKYPVESVQTMARIAERSESALPAGCAS